MILNKQGKVCSEISLYCQNDYYFHACLLCQDHYNLDMGRN